jgi:hypothetical protein
MHHGDCPRDALDRIIILGREIVIDTSLMFCSKRIDFKTRYLLC